MAIGRKLISGLGMGTPLRVSYDGNPIWRPGSITIGWGLVAAVSGSDYTTPEGIVVPIGSKVLRSGQVLCRVTTAQTITVTVNGTPTGGNITYELVDPTSQSVAAVTVAYNVSVVNHQAAIDAAIGTGKLTVSGSGTLTGNVHTLTVSGMGLYAAFPLPTLKINGLTGGTSPTAVFAVTAGANSGLFGPYDNGATDGRQTLTQGNCGILDQTVLGQNPVSASLPSAHQDQTNVIVGGPVWRDRVLAGPGTLAGGPTWANLLAALPEIRPVGN